MFLPDLNLNEFPSSTWVDVSNIGADQWERLLFEVRPAILITGWGTPDIPERFARWSELPLRYICNVTGGIKSFVPRCLLERGILVSNWGTTISHTIAEHAMLLTLGALRNLPLWNGFMDMPADRTSTLRTQSLRGKRIGLHGFGGIARELVGLLKPFRVELAAYSFGVPRQLFEDHDVRFCESLEELFSISNVIIECEALTPQSRGSVTEAIFSLLPNDGAFINVGRGAVVDEAGLVQLAAAGKIRVALDTFQQEPLPSESALLRIPGALLSPHIAGPTTDGFALCGEFAMTNLRHYLRGEMVDGAVTLEIYDRST